MVAFEEEYLVVVRCLVYPPVAPPLTRRRRPQLTVRRMGSPLKQTRIGLSIVSPVQSVARAVVGPGLVELQAIGL